MGCCWVLVKGVRAEIPRCGCWGLVQVQVTYWPAVSRRSFRKKLLSQCADSEHDHLNLRNEGWELVW